MIASSVIPHLSDIIEAIERVNVVLADVSLEAFEDDWQLQWLVQRGVEIISEASRHLPDGLKARNPEIPWQKVAGIGNVLRHKYESIAAAVLWNSCNPICQRWKKPADLNWPSNKVENIADSN